MLRLLLVALMSLLPLRAAAAEEIVAGLSQARVAITTDFSGTDILIFGAVKRIAPAPIEPPLGVIITVAGPPQTITVRRKDRRMGIWVNADSRAIGNVPSFYAVTSSGPLDQLLAPDADARYHISAPQFIPAGTDTYFGDALLRIREDEGAFKLTPGGVSLDEDTLFRTAITLPANLTEGLYTTRIFLTRGGQVIDSYATSINVSMVGIERLTFNLATDQPLIYGLLCVAIAVFAGWGAATVFRLIRG